VPTNNAKQWFSKETGAKYNFAVIAVKIGAYVV